MYMNIFNRCFKNVPRILGALLLCFIAVFILWNRYFSRPDIEKLSDSEKSLFVQNDMLRISGRLYEHLASFSSGAFLSCGPFLICYRKYSFVYVPTAMIVIPRDPFTGKKYVLEIDRDSFLLRSPGPDKKFDPMGGTDDLGCSGHFTEL